LFILFARASHFALRKRNLKNMQIGWLNFQS